MAKGTVKWFSKEKGYGFITPEDGGKDVFCHFSAIQIQGKGQRNLEEGETVSYDVVSTPKGAQAQNVRRM